MRSDTNTAQKTRQTNTNLCHWFTSLVCFLSPWRTTSREKCHRRHPHDGDVMISLEPWRAQRQSLACLYFLAISTCWRGVLNASAELIELRFFFFCLSVCLSFHRSAFDDRSRRVYGASSAYHWKPHSLSDGHESIIDSECQLVDEQVRRKITSMAWKRNACQASTLSLFDYAWLSVHHFNLFAWKRVAE